jgi:ATP-dependent Clp protease ATP-binding subunit ClpX
MVNTPQDIKHVLITAEVVCEEASPRYWRRGEGVAFFEAWATVEGMNSL